MVRPVDKGSGIVIINTEEYVKKVQEDLEQNDKYEKLKIQHHRLQTRSEN